MSLVGWEEMNTQSVMVWVLTKLVWVLTKLNLSSNIGSLRSFLLGSSYMNKNEKHNVHIRKIWAQ